MARLADSWLRLHRVAPNLEYLTTLTPHSRNAVESEYNTWHVAVVDSVIDTKSALSAEPMLALHLVGELAAWTETQTAAVGVVVIGQPERIILRRGNHLVEQCGWRKRCTFVLKIEYGAEVWVGCLDYL